MRRLVTALIFGALSQAHLASAQSVAVWRLELDHSIRPAEGSPGMLGNVVSFSLTDDGSLYVAENGPARVTLYDKNGAFVRVVMRAGSGPGETIYPQIVTSGNRLIAYDPRLNRLTQFSATGAIISERPLGIEGENWPPSIWATIDGSVIVLNGQADSLTTAYRLRANGKLDTVSWSPRPTGNLAFQWKGPGWVIVGRPPFSPHGVETFDPAGRLVLGGSKRSQWFVLNGRDTVATVTLPDRAIPIAKAVRDSVWAVYRAKMPKYAGIDDVVKEDRIPTTLPPWLTFDIDRTGRWWIGRPGPDGALAAWDIVVDGRVVARAPVPTRLAEVRSLTKHLADYGKGLIALLHTDESGLPWIGVYRVVQGTR